MNAQPKLSDHAATKRRLARLQAKADKLVYAWVTARDVFCRSHRRQLAFTSHRHHIRGRDFTTREDVCGVCDDCHDKLHVRIGGKTLRITGNAEARNQFGRLAGLTIEVRRRNQWVVEAGR